MWCFKCHIKLKDRSNAVEVPIVTQRKMRNMANDGKMVIAATAMGGDFTR